MPVVSVDLAYRDYRDVGVVVLTQSTARIAIERIPVQLGGAPNPEALAAFLVQLAARRGASLLLLDGPQGWKDPANGLIHSRVCERVLNTPAKTGLPGSVKPANYTPFVSFSIRVFDALADLGWSRFSCAKASVDRTCVESFPFSAWRALGIPSLPSKAKARRQALSDRVASLRSLFPLDHLDSPTHDELQALVSGLAGLALERGEISSVAVVGTAPFLLDGSVREGYIVNPLAPVRSSRDG